MLGIERWMNAAEREKSWRKMCWDIAFALEPGEQSSPWPQKRPLHVVSRTDVLVADGVVYDLITKIPT